MRFLRLPLLAGFVFVLALGGAAPAAAQPPSTERQEDFLPVNELPPQDQLAAGPLLIAAYAFVLAALFLYLVSLSRRMTVVQREVERLEADIRRTGRT